MEYNSGVGLDVMGPEEMTKQLLAIEDDRYGEEEVEVPVVTYSSLAGTIMNTFEENRQARQNSGIEDEIFQSLRANNGEYDPQDIQLIEQEGGSKIYMNLTPTKIRAAQSWIKDILLPSTEDIYTFEPTPLPSLPDDLEAKLEEAFLTEYDTAKAKVQEGGPVGPKQAQETIIELNRNKRDIKEAVLDEINTEAKFQMYIMEQHIKDDMKEGEWEKALSEFIEDFCVFPASFMKGPVITKRDKQTWEGGKSVVRESYCFINKRINPADIYPSPSATEIKDGKLCEVMRLSEKDVYEMKSLPGYFTDAIDKVLEGGPTNFWMNTNVEYELAEEEKRGNTHEANRGLYHAIHYWGTANTVELEELDLLEVGVEDPLKVWEIEAILINNEVIRAKLNTDPLKRRPYYKASYQNIPGSFWGRSLPNLMRDIQRMCNACARALANNMGLSSGPQVEVYIDRLADAGDIEDMKPNKIWQVTTDPTGAGGRAINFFQTPSIANELMAVYDKFEQKADDATGIPRYSYGNEKVGGAAQALSNQERVIVPSGSIKIKDLSVGDEVCNTYGGTSKVLGVHPQEGLCDIFSISFSNGEIVECDMNHRWSVRTHNNREFKTLTTEEILDKGLYRKSGRPKWMLPRISEVFYKSKSPKVDPYTFGTILGRGDKRGRVTSSNQELFDNIPYEKGKPQIQEDSLVETRTILGVKKNLKVYLTRDGHIHKDYIEGSAEERKDLLKGLMDSRGNIAKDSSCTYFTTSPILAEDIKKLVRSLGGTTNSTVVERDSEGITGYRVHFYTPFTPSKLRERVESYKEDRKLRSIYISSIKYVGKKEATCISVDSKDHCFLVDNYIVTHNTAQGLSMLMESATKSIKDAIRHIDTGLIRPRMEYQFHWHLIKNDTPYTGDINVITHASNSLTMKGAQAAKRQEFLQITANEMDQKLMGPEGRAELIRELAKDLNLRTQIVPSRLELKRMQEEEKAAQAKAQEQQMQMESEKASTGVQVAQVQGASAQSLGEQRNEIEKMKMQQSNQQHLDRMTLEKERLTNTKEGTATTALGKAQDNEVKREIARTKAAVDMSKI